jgi:hypothetical protein
MVNGIGFFLPSSASFSDTERFIVMLRRTEERCLHAERLIDNQFSKLSNINTPPSRLSAGAIHGKEKGFSPEETSSLLVNHFVQEFKPKPEKDLSSVDRALHTPHKRVKRIMSSTFSTSIEIHSLFGGYKFLYLPCGRFEQLFQDLFRPTLEPIGEIIRGSKIDESNVPEIILSSAQREHQSLATSLKRPKT